MKFTTSFYTRKFSRVNKMKKIIFLFLFSILFTAGIKAQEMIFHGQRHGPLKKIEELERVKLIEALNMDEQTTLKFFARRNEYRRKQADFFQKSNELIGKLDEEINKGKPDSDDLKRLIKEYLVIENDISNNRENFVKSLNDILSPEQIGKYLVFERKFREEIREVIFRERRKGKW